MSVRDDLSREELLAYAKHKLIPRVIIARSGAVEEVHVTRETPV